MQWQSLDEQQNLREAEFKASVESVVELRLQNMNTATQAQFDNLVMDVAESSGQSKDALQELSVKVVGLEKDLASNSADTDWDVSELRYLVKMAQRKMALENDIKSAIEIFAEADAMLAKMDDISYLPLREAIALDTQRLKALTLNDPAKGAISLTALLSMAKDLQFTEPDVFYDTNSEQVSDDPGQWWQNLKVLWGNLVHDFLTVEKLDQPIEPYLDQKQKQAMKLSLRYSLITARHALLHLQQELYQRSLEEAQVSLSKFDSTQPNYQVMADELQALISAPFPTKVSVVLTSTEYFSNTNVEAESRVTADDPEGAKSL
jgi:uroporphyrin-3 C-methyltransferase